MSRIWDIWQTTWDRKNLFTSLTPQAPIDFVKPGRSGSANIVLEDKVQYQTIAGFGGSLTDTSALTLNTLKITNPANYWHVLRYMFSPTDGANAAGLNYIRVPLGASDFSSCLYSLDDVSSDTSFIHFKIDKIPSYVLSVLKDILSSNVSIKIHILPWSPPAWMKKTGAGSWLKKTGSMNGGKLRSRYINCYSTYLLKAVQAFRLKGFPIYAISIQNEPQHSNSTYPTCLMTPDVEGRIAASLRTLLDLNGLGNVKIIGYEHNWDGAATYAVQLVRGEFINSCAGAFAGVAFHGYAGSPSNQETFHSAHPSKEIYFTECTGTNGSDWWSDIKWYMDNLWIGSLEHHSKSGLMWNIAADANGNPKLPGTSSCGGNGCRALVTVNRDGSYCFNQEFYSMAQASKAIIPKDMGGPYGQRIGVAVNGPLNWALRVSAFVTGRTSSTDWLRYSIVVLNWNDGATSTWNPQPVTTTIEFRGTQATYTFPVGVTTLWWFAPNND